MIDWDSLQITVLDEDRGVLTETERIYSMQAEQVMVIMSGAAGPAGPRGPKGEKGDAGGSAWGAITGTLSNQTDLQSALDSKPSDAPADDKLYGRQNGVWTPISSAGVVEWGDISGTLSDQTDLNTALSAKLGDAPSDGSEYVRKNGAWAVSSGGGGGAPVWGSITGTLSDQTDLQQMLDVKAYQVSIAFPFTEDLSYSAGTHYVTYKGRFYSFDGPYQGSWSGLTNKWEITVDELLESLRTTVNQKANTADLGAMASVADAPSDGSEYVRKNGAWAVSSGGGGGAPVWGGITGTLADQTDLNTALSAKADASTVYSKSEMDTALGAKADATSVYTKTEADALLADKADSADLASKADASAVYTKAQVDTALSGKADSSAVYSKTDVDTALNAKADSTAVYTKSEMDTALGAKANSADVTASLALKADASAVYTKSEVDTALGAKANTADLGDLATKDTVDYLTEIDNIPATFPPSAHTHDDRYYTESEVDTLLGEKQNTLTFDSTPTASSTNPVTSGGVKTALDTLDDSKVSKSGDTMTNYLTMEGTSNNFGLVLKLSDESGRGAAFRFSKVEDAERIYAYQFKNNNTNYDAFRFPVTDPRETTNGIYTLLSTKNVITTAQGGTGGTDSGWKSYTNSSVFTGTIYYRKIGIFAVITFSGLTLNSKTSSGTIDLGTLTYATGMTPTQLMTFPARIYGSGTNDFVTLISIYPTGSNGTRIRMYNLPGSPTLPTTATLHATAFYVI